MNDSELKEKYGALYLQMTHLQRYLEICLTDIKQHARVSDRFLLDDRDLELLIACLRVIKEEIKCNKTKEGDN